MLLDPRYLPRYKAITAGLIRHGFEDLVDALGLSRRFWRGDRRGSREEPLGPEREPSRPQRLRRLLEDLGPAIVKLGQVLSTRPDLLPSEYIAALEGLQDEVAPVPGELAVRVVEHELGVPVEALFEAFDRTSVASASLGQGHAARLPGGRPVAVKVQRPDAAGLVRRDLSILRDLARVIERRSALARRHDIRGIADERARAVLDELDYRLEARNARLIAANLRDFPEIRIPEVIDRLTTRRVLTTGWAAGVGLATLGEAAAEARPALADTLLRAYLKRICVDGVFHGDPHPGNVLLGEGGGLVLLDFGRPPRLRDGRPGRGAASGSAGPAPALPGGGPGRHGDPGLYRDRGAPPRLQRAEVLP